MHQSWQMLTSLCFLILTVASMNPPLWAEKFSTDFSAKISNFRTKGTYWYDAIQNAQKLHFDNGNTIELCQPILPENTSCSLLTVDQRTYFIFPQKRICCFQKGFPIRGQDWLEDFNFLGEKEIQGELFYEWESPQKMQRYYEDQSTLRRPRQEFYTHGRLEFNYHTKTYSEQFENQNVFEAPSYCRKSCEEFDMEEDKKQKELYS